MSQRDRVRWSRSELRSVGDRRPTVARGGVLLGLLGKGLRFNDPRHSAATILLAAGVAERVVMEIVGHSTLAMVKRYGHVLPGSRSPRLSAWTG